MNHIVKVLDTGFVTHDVKRFTVEKPEDYHYIPGQATDISINKPSLENELRPFTFTSLADTNTLEFIIKIYKGHNGVTEKLNDVVAGDELIIHDVFGTIAYHGPGLFLAAGAGITPFIAIFRSLQQQNKIAGNTLLFGNRTEQDIILKEELSEMLGNQVINVLEKSNDPNVPGPYTDKQLIAKYLSKDHEYFYICGPVKYIAAMKYHLGALGIEKSRIIIEQ